MVGHLPACALSPPRWPQCPAVAQSLVISPGLERFEDAPSSQASKGVAGMAGAELWMAVPPGRKRNVSSLTWLSLSAKLHPLGMVYAYY